MEDYISVLRKTRLFAGVGENEIDSMLRCLDAAEHVFMKGEYVYHQGEIVQQISVLVRGKLHVQREDYWGNRSIINMIDVGDMFGEAYASPESGAILNDVVAVEDSTVIFFDVKKVLTVCSSACHFHSIVVQNLVYAISERNRQLVRKLGHMSKRSTRDKLMSYLSEESGRQRSGTVYIPFNRQQLADYLSVDRSAMSNELGRMRKDGLIRFERNRFTLLDTFKVE